MERKTIIINLINKKYTYAEVGRFLGITRQRVHQIYSGYKSPIPESIIKKEELKKFQDNLKINNYLLNIGGKYLLTGVNITALTGMASCTRERLREIIRIRDNHTCQICGKVWKVGERRFDVHHNDEEFDGKAPYLSVDECDRKNLNKMITLCHKCHLNLEMTRNKMEKDNRG